MGFYDEAVLPRLTHWVMSLKEIGKLRDQALAPVTGTVLEVGFGSRGNWREPRSPALPFRSKAPG